jgi:hypothetical protein
MGYSDGGDSEGAARKHLAAAKVHETAGTDAARDGDMAGAESHYEAASLHRRAASMHSAGVPIENDDDESDDDEMEEELTGNMVHNYAGADPLPQPDSGLFSAPSPRRFRPERNVRPATLGDTLDTPEVILHNIGFGNELDKRGAGGQPKMHSWDGGLQGSVEKGDVNLGTTVGNPQFGDRITPRTMTPEEFLEEALAHDSVTRENRRRQGLPDEDIDTDDLLETPGTISTILGEMKYKGKEVYEKLVPRGK